MRKTIAVLTAVIMMVLMSGCSKAPSDTVVITVERNFIKDGITQKAEFVIDTVTGIMDIRCANPSVATLSNDDMMVVKNALDYAVSRHTRTRYSKDYDSTFTGVIEGVTLTIERNGDLLYEGDLVPEPIERLTAMLGKKTQEGLF